MHKTIILLAIFLGAFYFGFSQKDQFSKITDKSEVNPVLEYLSNNTNSIKSEFIQEKKLSFLTENITSTGNFYFKKENSLRWEYSSPFEYLIIFHNKTIQIKDGDKVSSFDTESNRMFKEINDMMIGMINGSMFHNNDNFKIEYFQNSMQFKLQMYPVMEEMKGMIKQIDIYIDKKDKAVSEITIKETEEDYTSIKFNKRVLNEEISDQVFDIKL